MKLDKYEDKSKKNRKIILISLGVIVTISLSLLLYKTFASFNEHVEFPIINGKVDYFGNSDVYFAFYKGDEKLDSMPVKNNSDNLVFDHGECDNGARIIWDNEAWGPMVKNLSKSKTKCRLYFDKYKPTVGEYIMSLAQVDQNNLIIDDTKDTNVRFIGSSPNNYIDIGDKDSAGNPTLWRIIGVFKNITSLDDGVKEEDLVKIIRSDSIGYYSWDSSLSDVNGGFGVNEWSEADIMKLLNPNTVYSGTPTIGGSLYWNKSKGNCFNSFNESHIPCDFTNTGISDEAIEKIAKVRWNTGTIGEVYDDNKITAKYMYDGERSTHNGKEHCVGTGGTYCTDTVDRTTTWDGYIGLVYPSDYGYAVGKMVQSHCLNISMHNWNNENCSSNNWLKQSAIYWTMTPVPFQSVSDNAFTIDAFGSVNGTFTVYGAISVHPVAYLKSTLKIAPNPHQEKEYGSKENPFILN